MIKATKPHSTTIPAAALVRMSSDDQEQSPEQQRKELVKLAERHNCNIVDWYEDLGISGVDTKKRDGFQRMLKEAQQGKFEVILAYDQDRFSRLDSIDSGAVIAPLRNAGVRMITVAQGVIDWTTFAGRLIYSVQQEGKNQYLVDRSRNTMRGKIDAAKRGVINGIGPWGFDREFYDPAGKLVHRATWGVRFRKPQGWTVKIVPSSDPEILATIRGIFAEYLTSDCGPRMIARRLDQTATPSPMGGAWTHSGIAKLLRNRAYAGDACYGADRRGKFHTVDDSGELAKSTGRVRHGTASIVVVDSHHGIIARDAFDAVQAKLAGRKMTNLRARMSDYLLTGILRCGHCGGRLGGSRRSKDGHEYHYYVCRSHNSNGSCIGFAMNAKAIEQAAIKMLQEKVLDPSNFERLRKEIAEQAKSRKSTSTVKPKQIKEQIAKLNKQLERGAANITLVDSDDVPAVRKALRELRQQRDALQAELDAAATPAGESPDALADKAIQNAARLQERLQSGNPRDVREALRAVYESITVSFTKENTRFRLKRVVAEFYIMETGTAGRPR